MAHTLHHSIWMAIAAVAGGMLPAVSMAATTARPYKVTNLVSDGAVTARNTDPNLKNPWGMAFGPANPFWIADNATGLSTIYSANGTPNSLVVTIPTFPGNPDGSAPTGMVFNGTNQFLVKEAGKTGPATFLFAGEDGTISGWNQNVDLTNAVRMIDRSSFGAIYKGVATGHVGTSNFLYAANFHSGAIDVFDSKFRPALTFNGLFHDETMPSGFAPFNVENIKGKLFVTYAQQDDTAHDEVDGKGLGFVDVFSTSGKFLHRLASNGHLNAPWGMAVAPSSFGKYSGDLLVGNFGDGKIDAFDMTTGALRGQLKNTAGKAIAIDGLWALSFGNGTTAGKTTTLYFTAGLNDEADGLFGSISLASTRTSLAPTPSPYSSSMGLDAESFSSVLAVPEPASASLLAGGIGILAMRRRRR